MDGHIGDALKNGENANEDGGAATHGKSESVSTHSLQQTMGLPLLVRSDRRKICSDADMELKKTLRVCHSTRIAASASARHPGGSNPSSQCPGGVCQCPQIGCRRIAFEFSNDPVRNFWMTLLIMANASAQLTQLAETLHLKNLAHASPHWNHVVLRNL